MLKDERYSKITDMEEELEEQDNNEETDQIEVDQVGDNEQDIPEDDEENFEYFRKSFILKKFFKILLECETIFETKRKLLIEFPNFSLYETFDNIKKEGESVLYPDDVQFYLALD
jgi:hypothetical protein